MAQLKDTIVSGNLRVTDTTLTDTLQVTIINAPTSSGGTTYGPGTNGQILKSNGTTTYWAADSNTDTKVSQTADNSNNSDSYELLISNSANNTTETAGVRKSTRLRFNPSTGRVIMQGPLIVRATDGAGSYDEGIRINAGKNGYSSLSFGGGQDTISGTADGQFWIGTNSTNDSYKRKLYIAHATSTSSGTYFYASSATQGSPALKLGTSGSIASGNGDAVTGGVVYTALSNYLPLSGGTMTGAINFANNTMNKLGDDVQFGDGNVAGHMIVQGLNNTTGINLKYASDSYPNCNMTVTTKSYANRQFIGLYNYDGSGTGVVLGGETGGLMLLGGGESPQSFHNIMTNASTNPIGAAWYDGTENTLITADGEIYFMSGAQSLGSSTHTDWTHCKTIVLDTSGNFNPTITNKGSVGTSSKYWATSYITTMYGQHKRPDGGSWISARTNAAVWSNSDSVTGGSFYPATFSKTKSGGWAMGTLGNDDSLIFSYTTDTDFSSGANTSTYTIYLPEASGTVALTSKTFNVTRGSSVSTATAGYWAAMCSSSSTGSPVLPTSGKWWHVISMDWRDNNDTKNWISQLAIATQDGSGVWWRRNDTNGTSIDSFSWHRLAEGNSSGAATNVATEVGSSAGARPVFYAYLGDNTRVVYNTNFTYNPSGNVLTATTFAGALSGNAATATTATSANKLNTDAGTTSIPVYFSGGVPVQCTTPNAYQTNTTTNADYRVLFSTNANDTTQSGTTRKNINLQYNPSTATLKIGDFVSGSTATKTGKLVLGNSSNVYTHTINTNADKLSNVSLTLNSTDGIMGTDTLCYKGYEGANLASDTAPGTLADISSLSNTVSFSGYLARFSYFTVLLCIGTDVTARTTVQVSAINGYQSYQLIWGGAPTHSGGNLSITSGLVNITESSGTITLNFGKCASYWQFSSSSTPTKGTTPNIHVLKVYGHSIRSNGYH